MSWSLFAQTFVAVFIAEMGDKTQLATLGLASEGHSRLPVFLGSALALICTSAIAVLAGATVAKYLPPIYLKRAAGALFIGLGLWTLLRA